MNRNRPRLDKSIISMRLLLVDDEVELTQPLQRLLTNQGYTVDVANSGDRGLSLALVGEYDLLILDWMMPERSAPPANISYSGFQIS